MSYSLKPRFAFIDGQLTGLAEEASLLVPSIRHALPDLLNHRVRTSTHYLSQETLLAPSEASLVGFSDVDPRHIETLRFLRATLLFLSGEFKDAFFLLEDLSQRMEPFRALIFVFFEATTHQHTSEEGLARLERWLNHAPGQFIYKLCSYWLHKKYALLRSTIEAFEAPQKLTADPIILYFYAESLVKSHDQDKSPEFLAFVRRRFETFIEPALEVYGGVEGVYFFLRPLLHKTMNRLRFLSLDTEMTAVVDIEAHPTIGSIKRLPAIRRVASQEFSPCPSPQRTPMKYSPISPLSDAGVEDDDLVVSP